MGDMLAMAERLAEARELERLREENARLRGRVVELERRLDYPRQLAAASAQSPPSLLGQLAALQGYEIFGPSSLRKHMQAEHFRLFGF